MDSVTRAIISDVAIAARHDGDVRAANKTALPDGRPTALTDAFLADHGKVTLWKAFLQRIQLPEESLDLHETGTIIADFLLPTVESAKAGNAREALWNPKGPWVNT